jgi:hypothetical protein
VDVGGPENVYATDHVPVTASIVELTRLKSCDGGRLESRGLSVDVVSARAAGARTSKARTATSADRMAE